MPPANLGFCVSEGSMLTQGFCASTGAVPPAPAQVSDVRSRTDQRLDQELSVKNDKKMFYHLS
jgi:hypothetical protein